MHKQYVNEWMYSFKVQRGWRATQCGVLVTRQSASYAQVSCQHFTKFAATLATWTFPVSPNRRRVIDQSSSVAHSCAISLDAWPIIDNRI